MAEILLGSKVKDTISGFTGILTSRTKYVFGCTRVCVTSQTLHDGKPVEGFFDEGQIVLIEERAIETQAPQTPGGGTDPAPRSQDHR